MKNLIWSKQGLQNAFYQLWLWIITYAMDRHKVAINDQYTAEGDKLGHWLYTLMKTLLWSKQGMLR